MEYKKMPLGIIIILIFNCCLSITYLLPLFNPIYSQFGPFVLNGYSVIIAYSICFFTNIIVLVGIFKSYSWSKNSAITWYTFLIIIPVSRVLTLIADKSYYQEMMKAAGINISLEPNFIYVTCLSGMLQSIIYVLIIYYLIKNKAYFEYNLKTAK